MYLVLVSKYFLLHQCILEFIKSITLFLRRLLSSLHQFSSFLHVVQVVILLDMPCGPALPQ